MDLFIDYDIFEVSAEIVEERTDGFARVDVAEDHHVVVRLDEVN